MVSSYVRTYPSGRFDWDSKHNILSTEASMLCGAGASIFSRLYDDACDSGFGIESKKTGQVEYFYLEETKFDSEGDIFCWVLKPINKYLSLIVNVFND